MNCFFFFISRFFFKRLAILIVLLLVTFSVESKEIQKIPRIFHWIHLDLSPLSKEEITAIKSWQEIHPQWLFKLWTNTPCRLRNVHVCKIDPLIKDLDQLKKAILQKEGGIYLDLDLIGCKTLDPLVDSCSAFQTADAHSIIGCAANQYDTARNVLPDSFILPDQVFTTQFFSSDLNGVCFRDFKMLPGLTKELRKIHVSKTKAKIQAETLSTQLSTIKYLLLIIFVLCLLNAFLFIRYFSFFSAFFPLKKINIPLVLGFVLSAIIFSFKNIDLQSFISLSNLEHYSHKLTTSDLKQLALYEKLFTDRFFLSESTEKEQIPHTIHFIWGGNPFPESSIANLMSWMQFHPGWTFKFWTDDINRPLPVDGMEKHLFEEILSSSSIRPYYESAKNWGEKSDLLRYEILRREGGVYIDHDIECLRSFTPLHSHVTFYASAEPFHKSQIFNSHLTLSNCLIGAQPDHPILSQALTLSLERWDLASRIFPCDDQLSTLFRTLFRTFSVFDAAVQTHITDSNQSIILPSSFVFFKHIPNFDSKIFEHTNYPLASHQWTNTWFRGIHDIPSFGIPKFLIRNISSLLQFCLQTVYVLLSFFLFLAITLFLFKFKRRNLCLRKSSFSFSQ